MGNYALLDITQALLWLRENIASFNGDPQRVTLFGHGSGAAIVNLLMLSPFIKGGFLTVRDVNFTMTGCKTKILPRRELFLLLSLSNVLSQASAVLAAHILIFVAVI